MFAGVSQQMSSAPMCCSQYPVASHSVLSMSLVRLLAAVKSVVCWWHCRAVLRNDTRSECGGWFGTGGGWGGGKAVIHVSCARVPPRRGSGTQARSGHT